MWRVDYVVKSDKINGIHLLDNNMGKAKCILIKINNRDLKLVFIVTRDHMLHVLPYMLIWCKPTSPRPILHEFPNHIGRDAFLDSGVAN